MFTGLVEDTGSIAGISPEGGGRRLRLRTAIPLADVAIGDSIACNGVCLTVERTAGDIFEVVAGRETLAVTTVGGWKTGDAIHMERALAAGQRLGGHLVQGHVDGVGRVVRSEAAGESWIVWVDATDALARYIASKGSICIDGVSLTVNEVAGSTFRVNLVPHTTRVTHLGRLAAGDVVNLEVDVLARYVERMLSFVGGKTGLTFDKLKEHGFT